jgi:hypothetical protein
MHVTHAAMHVDCAAMDVTHAAMHDDCAAMPLTCAAMAPGQPDTPVTHAAISVDCAAMPLTRAARDPKHQAPAARVTEARFRGHGAIVELRSISPPASAASIRATAEPWKPRREPAESSDTIGFT